MTGPSKTKNVVVATLPCYESENAKLIQDFVRHHRQSGDSKSSQELLERFSKLGQREGSTVDVHVVGDTVPGKPTTTTNPRKNATGRLSSVSCHVSLPSRELFIRAESTHSAPAIPTDLLDEYDKIMREEWADDDNDNIDDNGEEIM